MTVTFVSLFAGAGGLDLGLEAAGLRCVAQVEWDPQCQRVLRHHWPDVPKWGDVTTVNGALLPPADVIAFGFPCQDVSVAGNRGGLRDGERSSLFTEGVRIVAEMRDATHHQHPQMVLIENVAGLLSGSDEEEDDDATVVGARPVDDGTGVPVRHSWFGTVLGTLADVGALDICWRVLDAKHFGVPQRRRRVFVVADFGGQRAAQVLLDRQGVRGDPAASTETGTDAAPRTGDGAPSGGVAYQCHGSNVGPLGALRAGNGNSAAGVPFGVFSPGAYGQFERERERAEPARPRRESIERAAHRERPRSTGGERMTTKPKRDTSSSVTATLNSGGNQGGFRTEPGEHLVIVHE